MDIMYIKYKGNERKTIIKDKSDILEFKTIISNDSSKTIATPSKVLDFSNYKKSKNEIYNDEITNFFLEKIHKNYLKNRL